ncbi:VWA domain-containing protein [Enterococcus raffinosus]|uniref:VWA domain-containing protein n=1 Tax=Enterococcus raffinosus TaxID=71452 RepID=A0AAW8T4W1_9ENTE|nr:VWA domain-containing protein [Enterococcus raffinosus]MDT2525032.1 VWA domain-containing protein [Enterococcus raffinosus]MDT2531474.1 VWA domain-containing protein [Enterococcus raffinosus]MDT2532850.1 VWA domain-containing protein [Enterococcus raffinosus]MDT2543963.1 VWA domain-containing protein [Enterococcus raffinosus]MDT2556548.1 VWA domain-containing protein [Enterococcus raffinosus]
MKNKYFIVFGGLLSVLFIFFIANSEKVRAVENKFQYESTQIGDYITNGVANGDTYNYGYQGTQEIPIDNEGFVNYDDQAYVKKTVKANPQKQGLFDVTLDIKGNQISHSPIDIVLVIDYSSSMKGEKLTNALKGLQEFGNELGSSFSNGVVKIGIVAYNRNVYSTNGFTNDMSQLENFLTNTAESHTGTFIQKRLYAAQDLFVNHSRAEAEKMLIHIGDGSANRSYLPTENATLHTNNGEITAFKDWHTDSYYTDFQTSSDKFNTSDNISDTNGTLVDKAVVTDATLGTIVALKRSNIISYSIGTAPTARGEYIARNIADKDSHYRSIDENLVDLGEALKDILSVTKTIPNGTVIDPMGKDILLQGSGNFLPENYTLTTWRRDASGTWIALEQQTNLPSVTEQNQVITLSNLSLGENDRVTLTYQIRLNTEANDFKGDFWYLCNQRTTLDPNSDGTLLDFPIPSIKAPKVSLELEKKWKNTPESLIPEKIDYQVSRTPLVTSTAWTTSDTMALKKEKNFKTTITTVSALGVNNDLPLYNNAGDTISYSINEVNIPADFELSTSQENNHFILTNTYKKTTPSSTEPSNSQPASSESTSSSVPAITTTESTKKQVIAKAETKKRYPQTNDKKSSAIWIVLGTSLIGFSSYFLKKIS